MNTAGQTELVGPKEGSAHTSPCGHREQLHPKPAGQPGRCPYTLAVSWEGHGNGNSGHQQGREFGGWSSSDEKRDLLECEYAYSLEGEKSGWI